MSSQNRTDLPEKIRGIFKFFDGDGDDFLNYHEFLAFLRIVNPAGAPKFDFTAFTKWCQRVNANPDKGLTIDQLYVTYSDLDNTDEALSLHYDKVMASPRPDTQAQQQKKVQEVIDQVQKSNAERGELLRQALIELEIGEERDMARNRRQSAIARDAFRKTASRRRSTVLLDVPGRRSSSSIRRDSKVVQGRRASTPGLNLGTKKVTLDFVTAMMDNFQAGILLDAPTVIRIVAQTIDLLEPLPNVVEAKIVEPASLTVVGDLHGQLEDLLHIFQLNGLPSARNQYLFNGDWVDRGDCGVEIVLIIFAFKVLFPDGIYMNRGNHEATDVNSDVDTYAMCFYKECMQKYDREVYDLFSEAFAACPIATVINGKYFVVHGGLCHKTVKIAEIQKIDRYQMHPPYDTIFEDLLWSDPHNKKGIAENDRGCSILFGSQSVAKFLKDHKLAMMIRSHEKKEEGYEFMFKKRLCTVFSASNYCDEHENDGAVMVIRPDLSYKFLTWNLDPQNAKVGMFCLRYALKQDVVLSKLVKRISRARLALIAHWKKSNDEKKRDPPTSITRKEWADGLAKCLRLKINFIEFQDMLGLPAYGVNGKPEGPIDFMEFLSRFAPVSHHFKAEKNETETGPVELKQSLAKLSELVAEMGSNLQTLFSYFDMSGTGTVTTGEFETGLLALKALNNSLSFTEEEVVVLTKFFDSNGTGFINFDEFFNGFSVHDKKFSKTLDKFNKPRVPRRKGSIVLKSAPPIGSMRNLDFDSTHEDEKKKNSTEKKPSPKASPKKSTRSRFFGFFKRKKKK
mmetsp:Transcript_5040/g.9282  ORF Transcript_5040/g.9282 Transcript_5040/m.9282 type:complete len:794 (+) Transcript_5040:252-2633(+)|eukprot:CAMPEP_0197521090 /NCGR_PEP_ID=MMETSP1318-20131121/6375_1 /TAXON_ID=552666 /ORGANISM="Partenskyella glossopodia, Strain RCC365" /LENGTH=793 /DNA_ID=CAMNT_0043072917 /DNA_START=195 /DNA_END=2576 /DNA_ORIENTATION=+